MNKTGTKFKTLPIEFFVGKLNGEEVAIDENTFTTKLTLTHWLFGELYSYKGILKIQDDDIVLDRI